MYLVDVNVLVALSLDTHPYVKPVKEWYEREDRPCLQVCRIVQLGFLRVLTTEAAAGAGTLTNKAALDLCSKLLKQGLIKNQSEPRSIDSYFAERASFNRPSPKRWSDAYLSAFAAAADLRLVTCDAALAGYTPGSILLRP